MSVTLALTRAGRDRRVIPAHYVAELQRVARGLSEAGQHIEQVEADCLDEMEVLQQRCRDTGLQQGMQAASSRTLKLISALERRYNDQREHLIELVMAAVTKIVANLPVGLVTSGLIEQALDELNDSQVQVTVVVNPSVANTVNEQLTVAQASRVLNVETDDSLDPTDCRLQTVYGAIEAGLDTQLAAIAEAMGEPDS